MKNLKQLLLIIALSFCCLSGNAAESSHDHSGHDHEDHSQCGGHAGEFHDGEVPLTEAELSELSLITATAGPGVMAQKLEFPGTIMINGNRTAQIVPRVTGIVTEIKVDLGFRISTGEVMAVLESRELLGLISTYLDAKEKTAFQKASYNREQTLRKKDISSEQEFLVVKKDLKEAEIALESARQELLAAGLSNSQISELKNDKDNHIRYELCSPISGTVIERNITLGQRLCEEEVPYKVSDLSTVWVEVNIYDRNFQQIAQGNSMIVRDDSSGHSTNTKLTYLSSYLDEKTRFAQGRSVLKNPQGVWKPGSFVTVTVMGEGRTAMVVIPEKAVISLNNEDVVFMPKENGIITRPVQTGLRSGGMVEILSGMYPGDDYVSKGVFELKAKIVTSGLDPHAGHGH